MTETSRLTILKDAPPRDDGRYVLYWMQQAARAEGNPALDHAVELANGFGLPVVVGFGLTGAKGRPYPEANARHYAFLLEGLADVAAALDRRGIAFVIRHGSPVDVTVALAKDAAILVCDRGYLKPQLAWRADVVERVACRIVQVETDVVVPIDVASEKHEFGARTIRPKIERAWDDYLVDHKAPRLRHKAAGLELASDVDLSAIDKVVAALRIDHGVGPVRRFQGGLAAARKRLATFLSHGFHGYKEARSEPAPTTVSHLSPYLHFGQVSPVEIALAARAAKAGGPGDRASFLDELIVRRELAFNHVAREPHYDSYEGLPPWARKTLDEQRGDKRPHLYTRRQLEAGETHDRYWNGAMREMRETGYMHNRLRMYWGKKIVEWSPSPEEAFATTMAINNRFFVDGRDANSFTNVGWLFGLHDRPWFRRPVFGLVRYMGDNTLKKFDADAYLRSVDSLVAAEAG